MARPEGRGRPRRPGRGRARARRGDAPPRARRGLAARHRPHRPPAAFIDFLCPFCRQFQERSRSLLNQFVEDHVATLVYHPLGFLDRLSVPGGYSTRAAAACAASSDADMFLPYKEALFANQPEEGGPGLDDEELVDLGRSVGIEDPRFADAVFSGTYQPWVRFVTELAVERGVGGTPTLLVGGIPVPANPQTIAAAVAELTR